MFSLYLCECMVQKYSRKISGFFTISRSKENYCISKHFEKGRDEIQSQLYYPTLRIEIHGKHISVIIKSESRWKNDSSFFRLIFSHVQLDMDKCLFFKQVKLFNKDQPRQKRNFVKTGFETGLRLA